MFTWLESMGIHVTEWLGSGIASAFKWLFGGLVEILTKIIDAAGGLWDVLTALLDLLFGFKDVLYELLLVYVPFLPEPVAAVIALGLLAGVIFGIVSLVRKVRG